MDFLTRPPLFVIAGPCVIESAEVCLAIGRHVKSVCDRLGLAYVFKASFDKANRSSNSSFRGPGLTDGLVVLERVKAELGVPVLTDVHESEQVPAAAKVVDILQVNDFTGLPVMKSFGCPVVFDITHSTQQPAGLGNQSGGNPQYSPLLARAAVAAGVDGLFLECHPEPKKAKSDAATMLSLEAVEPVLTQCRQIAELRKSWSMLPGNS